ncbi:MAG TPA: hypothetical protein VG986_14085 [Pseudolabrys sp.]|nr:hypothetical protein [Pseudolabrys sp.]
MNHEIGGWLWLVIDVVMVAVLGGALIYGTMRWRAWKRRPDASEQRDRATRELFGRH